jgi:1-acyl-sn-glycerol-3-phosphate acyltransferase
VTSLSASFSQYLPDEDVEQDKEDDERDNFFSKNFFIPPEQVHAIVKFGSEEKEKIINAFGIWTFAATLFTCTFWMAAMGIVEMWDKFINSNDAKNDKALFDKTGKIWAKTWLSMIDSYPTISGDVGRLEREDGGACLYVANHASWLDIAVLCTVLDPVFKFIAKGELTKVPCIGHQLVGGKHILIDREDRRSQLKTFKDAIGWLKQGVPIMAFPEGKRSPDGRLMEFKGGSFSMATKTGVPIVPISISNTHAVMPKYSWLPVQPGSGKLHVHIHDPIYTDGKTEKELEQLVREALLSKLPTHQHPLVNDEDAGESSHNVKQLKIVPGPSYLRELQNV